MPISRSVSAVRRARAIIGVATLVLVLALGGGVFVIVHEFGRLERQTADERALDAVDLLSTVGVRLPDLTPARISRGLSSAQAVGLRNAVLRGRREGVLSDLVVWDGTGRAVFASAGASEGRNPTVATDVRRALGGHEIARRLPGRVDRSTGRRTGVLAAFEPLRDDDGHVYAVLEAARPLAPLLAGSSQVSWRVAIVLVVGGLALWLAAVPWIARMARRSAEQFVAGRRKLIRAFKRGLATGEFEMVYQPQVDPSSQCVFAVEALVRWRRDGSVVAPDAFLPAVESSPLMWRLTDRVLALALSDFAGLLDDWPHMRLSVNCSAFDLTDPHLDLRIAAALDAAGVAGEQLTLEVTETAVLGDLADAARMLEAITALGVDIAIDDFGTGHASISRLHRLPIAEVKIDRSFMGADSDSRRYVASIVRFGQSLGLRVVGEGVEDQAAMANLAGLRCDLAQGYCISRPLSSAALRDWLRNAPLIGGGVHTGTQESVTAT